MPPVRRAGIAKPAINFKGTTLSKRDYNCLQIGLRFYIYYGRFLHFGLTTDVRSWKRLYRSTVWSFIRLVKNCEDCTVPTIYNRAGSASTRNAEKRIWSLAVLRGLEPYRNKIENWVLISLGSLNKCLSKWRLERI